MQTKPAKHQNICNKSIIATTFQLFPHIASTVVQFTPTNFYWFWGFWFSGF